MILTVEPGIYFNSFLLEPAFEVCANVYVELTFLEPQSGKVLG